MSTLAARRCVQHGSREAVARCPVCRQDFCRECVVEHAGQILCAMCLAKETAQSAPTRIPWGRVRRAAVTVWYATLLWCGFYLCGALLKSLPPDFHEGTVWREIIRP